MRIQFSTRSLLLATAFAAVWLAGLTAVASVIRGLEPSMPASALARDFLAYYASSSAVWVPLVALAYGVGRRKISVPLVIAFAICELAALAVFRWYLFSVLSP